MNGFSTKQPNGRFKVRWRGDGKERSRTFDTRADAQRFLASVRHATAFGLPLAESRPSNGETLGAIAALWWERKRATVRPRTAVSYSTVLRVHLPSSLLRTDVGTVKPRDVEALLASLPVPTAKKVRTVLSLVFSDAVRDGRCERNPVQGLRVLVRHATALRPEALPSLEDVERIASHVPERYRPLILVAAFGGLRLGEASGLRPSDISLASSTIRVERQWSQVERALTAPKTRAGNRTVVFAGRIGERLADHLARFGSESFVFTNGAGNPVHPTNFRTRLWQPAAVASGFPGMHFHTLRHIYASTLIAGGVNVALVARLMGHSNPGVTLAVYSHFFETDYSTASKALAHVG